MQNSRYWINRIGISKTNLATTLVAIENAIGLKEYGYICVTNSRTCYLANQDPDYRQIQNNSILTVPDGIPLVWIAHQKGFNEVGKVSGKDLMNALFDISVEKGYSHYFYGSTPETIELIKSNLKIQYPNLDIKGIISPPFYSLDKFNIDGISEEINGLKPTFFWCGLGAPKQEQLISRLQPKLEITICVGVGLAFEYFAGTVKRAPLWMQKNGLEWIYRLIQQPKKINRSIRPLSWIVFKLLSLYFKK